MELIDSIILGLTQGLTEFLPISSSGHLVIGKHLLGLSAPGAIIEIILHFGTFFSIILYYRTYLLELLLDAYSNNSGESRKIIGLILISIIPAGVIGILFDDYIEKLFNNMYLVGINLIITGVILFSTRFTHKKTKQSSLTITKVIIIGIAQAIAILPGISRSGITISTALFLGINEKDAARFSFLIALPVLFGASILKIKDAIAFSVDISTLNIFTGFLFSLITGYICLSILVNILNKKKLWLFSFYCIFIGILIFFL
jgi:undecaprenyl-diphosphatase